MSDSQQEEMHINRLSAQHAAAIVACFRQVYGDSYANEQFYDAGKLARLMDEGRLCCVGAWSSQGELCGHMAMTMHQEALSVEMGNTVVVPAARGHGVAWKVGAQLQAWAVELGYRGFLHYPTTDHHIMQRQSVTNGFETGLMLGYIPADTDGQVRSKNDQLRNAATIVYQPIGDGLAGRGEQAVEVCLPDNYAALVQKLCDDAGLQRRWGEVGMANADASVVTRQQHLKRGLARLFVHRVGRDIEPVISSFSDTKWQVLQIDFAMNDAAVEQGVQAARQAGFYFCGWLPGFVDTDVLRLQRCDKKVTNFQPDLANPTAQQLLEVITADIP